MLIEALAVAGGLGAVTGWIFAFRARGEAVAAKDALAVAGERTSAAILEAAQAKRLEELARTSAAASGVKIEALERGLEMTHAILAEERKAKGELLERLQAKGIPVGDVAVDVALDRLYPNSDD